MGTWYRTKRRRVESEGAERILGAYCTLAQDALEPLPDDGVGEHIRCSHDEHAA